MEWPCGWPTIRPRDRRYNCCCANRQFAEQVDLVDAQDCLFVRAALFPGRSLAPRTPGQPAPDELGPASSPAPLFLDQPLPGQATRVGLALLAPPLCRWPA